MDGADASAPNSAVGHLDEPCDVRVAGIDAGDLPFHQWALLRFVEEFRWLERVVAKEEDRIEFGLPVMLTILPFDRRGLPGEASLSLLDVRDAIDTTFVLQQVNFIFLRSFVVLHDNVVTVDDNVVGDRECWVHVVEASNLKLVDRRTDININDTPHKRGTPPFPKSIICKY